MGLPPFGVSDPRDLTDTQINWILEMYAADNPDKFKIEKGSKTEDLVRSKNIVDDWANHLSGAALEVFMSNPLRYIYLHSAQAAQPGGEESGR